MPTDGTTIGTWNVRTLYACGKIYELTHELSRYHWDIIGLCEVRWTGFGETSTDEGHRLWFSGDDKKHTQGVAFIVRKEIASSVISCTPISSRMISIRISAKPHNITIIQVYAPTTDHTDDEVEEFYELLETTMKNAPRKDILIVQGDWNAKVGPDAFENWVGTVGRYGIGSTNDRGIRLLEFAKSHNLTIANTLHPHKLSRTATWHSPDGKTHNQIDFILVPQRFKSSVNKAKTRTFPGADIGSDHDMVLANFKLKLKAKRSPKSSRISFDLDQLKDPEIAHAYQARVGGKFAALNLIDQDIDTLANHTKEVLLTTAQEVLGKRRKKNRPWVTSEVLDLCDERRKLKGMKHTSVTANTQYKIVHGNVRKKMRKAKQNWIDEQCSSIDRDMERGSSREAYKTLKSITTTTMPRAAVIDDKDGNLLTDSKKVLERWTEYCSGLYNYQIDLDTSVLDNNQAPRTANESPPVLKTEVEAAVRSLKTGKSPGVDNIPSELLKHGGDGTLKALTALCQKIWNQKQWPVEWTQSLVIPLPKKGNLRQCQNYRTISLISHPSKVMLKVILNRLRPQAEELLSEEQAGFRAGRSTVEQIFNCRLIIEKHLQHQRDMFHNFIDFKKAFDRVWHKGLWSVLRGFNIDEGLVLLIQALYEHSSSAVIMNNQLGDYFRTTIGVRQGCLLSPVLFNIFLERIIHMTLHDYVPSISIGGRPICNLRFANDIDLMEGSAGELQDLTNRLVTSASAFGMEVSTEKSKIMINSTTNTTANITMNGETLEEVTNFKYLGATLSSDGTCTAEIRIRIATATAAMASLEKIWKSDISFKTKFKLYRSLVLSTLLYGCESWTLLAETERRIQAFEMKSMRKLLRISYLERKTNEFVQDQVTRLVGPQEPLLATVKRRKLQWFGHTTRHDGLSKTILQGTVEGGRRRGRQRKSWSDNIKEWTALTMPELITHAADRPTWRRLSASSASESPRRRNSLSRNQ